MKKRWFRFLLVSAALIASGSAQPPWQSGLSRGEDLQIKLVTIDPGEELTMWWGHTALVVEDMRFNASLFYNYGIFSFQQDNFVSNFIMGRLVFWVDAWNTAAALDYYKGLNRSIRMQTLDFPPERRLELAKFLAWNVLPENREYLYDHYTDNCATRVRDVIDRMVDGQLAAAGRQPARMTLRQHTRCHTHPNFLMDLLLMFLMNDTIDQPVSRWEEMFLPAELERNIQNLSVMDSTGLKHRIVSEEVVFFEARGQAPLPEFAPLHWPVTWAAGGFLAFLGVYLALLFQARHPAGPYLFGIYHILIGIGFGIPGLALFLMSTFTNHTVTFYNENLFLANPLTLLLALSGFGIIRQGLRKRRFTPNLCNVLAGAAVCLLILKIFPRFDQDNMDVFGLVLPVLLSLSGCWYWIGKKSNFSSP